MKSLKQRLTEANIKIDTHATDLYFEDTKQSREILREYQKDSMVKIRPIFFVDNIEKRPWIEVPFANYNK